MYSMKYIGTTLNPMKASKEEINELAYKIYTLKNILTTDISKKICSITFNMSELKQQNNWKSWKYSAYSSREHLGKGL